MTCLKSKDLCRGCREDFYNGEGADECWSFKSAKVVRRWRLGWWTSPVESGAFVEVETLSCHREPGRYAFSTELPSHAVQPRRMADG